MLRTQVRTSRRLLARTSGAVAFVAVALVLFASPASADPAKPTNYRSEVTSLEPPVEGVAVDVIGGDAFVRLRVEPGHEVVVLGYYDEPYARVLPDGTVEQNAASPAVALNRDRYGNVDAQPDGDPDDIRDMPPRWERVGGNGELVWHDHRTHWMSTALPPQLGGKQSGVVFEDWVVPLVVDGMPVEVHGALYRDAPPSALPWLGLSVLIALAAVVALRTLRAVPVLAGTAVVLAVAAAAATALSAVGQFDLPAAAGRQYHLVAVPAIAVVAAVAGLALRRTPSGLALVVGAAIALLFWVVASYGVLVHAHTPTAPGEDLQRTVIAIGLGAVLSTTALAIPRRRPA